MTTYQTEGQREGKRPEMVHSERILFEQIVNNVKAVDHDNAAIGAAFVLIKIDSVSYN